MQLKQLSGTNIYIDSAVQAENAVWGYIPWGSAIYPTVDLATTWNQASGYYVFFPAADRGNGWKQFVSLLSNLMNQGTNRRFGFF